MKKFYVIINLIAFVITIVANYVSNTGVINGKTIGGVSGNLNTLFTPAGYAFAIWGLIYLLLLGFIIYQVRSLVKPIKDDSFIVKTKGWFALSCLANIGWIFSWLFEYTGLSLIFMFVLLVSLLIIVLNNKMELWDAPFTTIVFIWWPFVIYSGWITVASIANVSAYLHKIAWNGFGLSETTWTLIMIGIAGLVNLLVTWRRNMREFALVGAWALGAIAVANWHTNESVTNTALFVMGLLLGSSVLHAALNWKTNPLYKLITHYAKK